MDLGSDDDYEGGKAVSVPHARSIRVDSLTANLSPGGTKTFDLNLSAHGGGFGDDLDTGAFKEDSADFGKEVAQLAGDPSPDRFLPPERKLVQLEVSQPAVAFERSDSGSDWGSDDDEDDHADETNAENMAGGALSDSSSAASPCARVSPARSKDAGINKSRSKVLPPGQGQKFEGKFDFGEVTAAQQLTRQNAELLAQMDEQKLEIKRMQVAMDAAKPIAGLDPAKFLDVMHGTEMVDQDMRDKKIVELATQKRDLNVKLQAERDRHAATKKALAEAKKEVELMGSPAARAAAIKGGVSMGASAANAGKGTVQPGSDGFADGDAQNGPEADAAQARKECKALRRKVAALKRSVQQGTVELRRTQRALAKEVGETVLAATAAKESGRAGGNGEGNGASSGASGGGGLGLALEKVLEGGDGWKGRAQQIVMLRTKLRRVEMERDKAVSTAAALHDAADAAGVDISDAVNAVGGGSPHLAGTKARAAAAAARNRRERSVDTQAQAALDDMEAQRREAVEAVTAQNEQLAAQLGATNRKHDAARARVRVLEGTSKKQQAQLKTLLSKSKMDDELVEAQKKQLKLLSKQLHQAKLAALGDATSPSKPSVLATLASVGAPGSVASMASLRSSRSDASLHAAQAGAVPTPAQMQAQQTELKQERQERERLVAQNRDQGKRLERQEQVMSTLRREISSLRDRLALPEHSRPRRPDSRETRERARQAGAQLEAEAVLARGKADEIEIARLRELSDALNTKLDASEAKVRELEAQRAGRRRRVPANSNESENGVTKNRSPPSRRAAESSGSEEVEKLRQQLARALDENEAMRQSYHTSLSAMERELQLTKKASAQQRAEFDDTVARMRDHVQRSVVQATEHGVLSAFDAGSRENVVRRHAQGKKTAGQVQAKMASTRA